MPQGLVLCISMQLETTKVVVFFFFAPFISHLICVTLRSELKFSELFVQPPHYLVTGGAYSHSFSTFYKCFHTFMQKGMSAV